MPFDEFCKYFDQVSVCYYTDEYKLTSFEDQAPNGFMSCYNFKVEKSGEYYVMLSQKDIRGFKPNEK